MTDEHARPLHAMAGRPDVPTTPIGPGPLRPTKPEAEGDIDYVCPGCGTVLVEGTNASYISKLKALRCYKCNQWSTGDAALASSEME